MSGRKIMFLEYAENKLLNKKSEQIYKCRHTTWVSQKFYDILVGVYGTYITRSKPLKS